MIKKVKSIIAVLVLMLTMLIPVKAVNAEDTLAFTKPITIGGTISETLYSSATNAKYTFSLKRSGTLTVQLGFKEGSGYSWGYLGGITLYDRDGKKIERTEIRDNSDGTDSQAFTVDILAGDYYLYVDTKANDSHPSYIVITTAYVDSNETVVDELTFPHDSQANPIALPLDKVYTGHIANNGSSDVYKVELAKDVMLNVAMTNRTNGINFDIINTNNTVNKKYGTGDKAFTDKIFCPKGTYFITVSKYNTYGSYTIKVSTSSLATTSVKKLKNIRGKMMSVKFGLKSVNDAAGYQIQYSTSKNFKKGKKSVYIENNDYLKSTYTLSGLKKKKTYYVRIRTYMTDNRGDRYYSSWSKAKKIKIKK